MLTAFDAPTRGAVTVLKAGENQVLVYYPTPNAADASPLKLTCTAPLLLVYGDGTFDETAASAYARKSGLADIAAANGASVCFVNPINEAWSAADIPSYENVLSMIGDSSTFTFENGILSGMDWMTHKMKRSICASAQRVYLYGVGAGADFVTANYLRPVKTKITFPDGFTMEKDYTAAVITLNGASAMPRIAANDIPVVSIGGSEAFNEMLRKTCGSVTVDNEAGYAAQYLSVVGRYRRQEGVLTVVHDWAAEGIVEVFEKAVVKTDANNKTFPEQTSHEINYAIYYADGLDVENGNVPLVLCFHGGGNTALYEAQATEWPVIGKAGGFITASVDLHFPNCTALELAELIGVISQRYSIDKARVYASGFSMGGVKSWDLFEQCPQLFAGLAPMDATAPPGTDSFGSRLECINRDVPTPVFFVGGEKSPLPEMCFHAQKVVDRVKYLFEVNKVVKPFDIAFDAQYAWENPFWGVNGDMRYAVTDLRVFTDSVLTVQLFKSSDGKIYTALANASNMSHEVYARNSWAAWDFLSQFSRRDDGGISIHAVAYALPSDDSSVRGNAYNAD